MYYVYAHVGKHGFPFYIGKGKHKRAYSTSRSVAWYNYVRENLDGKFPKVVIVSTYPTESLAFEVEKKLIKVWGRISDGGVLVNRALGGQGLGGENNPHYGKKHTDEAKERISKSKTGKALSEMVRKKMSESHRGVRNAFYGKTHTHSTRKRLSELRTGTKIEQSQRNLLAQIAGCEPFSMERMSDGLIEHFTNQSEFVKKYDLHQAAVNRVYSGKQLSSQGWRLHSRNGYNVAWNLDK